MEAYLEGEEPTIEKSRPASARAPSKLAFFPTYCGSSFKNKGVQLVLDAVVDYLPNPTRSETPAGSRCRRQRNRQTRHRRCRQALRALAFKIMDDKLRRAHLHPHLLGHLKKGDTILNTFTGKTERVGRMVEMHADDRKGRLAQAGDIVAIVGMKNVQTGHTLCDEKNPATLEPMVFPDPVISIAVAPKTRPTPRNSATPSARWSQKTRPSASKPTRKPTR
jgi:elongation factor G